MNDKDKAGFCFALVLGAILIGLLVGVYSFVESNRKDHKEKVKSGYFLPNDAADIIEVGRGWQEFTYKGQRFLFHRSTGGERGYESIVRIDASKSPQLHFENDK